MSNEACARMIEGQILEQELKLAPPEDADETSDGTSRAEFAYQSLLDAMRGKVIRPGDRLREDEVSKRLGISRTPVRQALHRLQTRGLVVQAPGRGVVVAELSRQQVIELYAMRELLEGSAARLASTHAAPSDIASMRSVLREFQKAAPDADRLARINRNFHATVHEAAHNRYLSQMLTDLSDTQALLKGTTFTLRGRWKMELSENRALVGAIERHDADEAEQLARQNMREALKARLAIMTTA